MTWIVTMRALVWLTLLISLSVASGLVSFGSHGKLSKNKLNKASYLYSRTQTDVCNIESRDLNTAIKAVSVIALISAPLGTFLDNQHGLFGVLNYAQWNMDITIDDWHVLKSAYWVPFLFSFAGLAMSAIILTLDSVLPAKPEQRSPDWPSVFYCISLF